MQIKFTVSNQILLGEFMKYMYLKEVIDLLKEIEIKEKDR